MDVLLRREMVKSRLGIRLVGFCFFLVCTGLSGMVRIPLPFSPVPVTLQTFFVLLAGACLGSRWAAGSQLAYLGLGLAGAPLFSVAGSGWMYIAGPTGGYLIGFVLAASLLGALVRRLPARRWWVIGAFCAADLVILSAGALWLRAIMGLSLRQAVCAGILPFIVGDFLKACAAAHVYLKLQPRLKQAWDTAGH